MSTSILDHRQHAVGRAIETSAAWLLGVLWILPLVYAFWTAFHPGEFSTRFLLSAPLTLENFAKAWHAAPFARYFLNTIVLCTMILVAQLVLCTLAAYAFARFEFPGRNRPVCARARPVDGDARRADRRELPHHERAGLARHDPCHRFAVHGECIRHLPAAPDVQDRAEGTRRGGPDGGLHAAPGLVEGLRAARAAGVPGLRVGQRELSLEQFSLAAHHHQFGRVASD